MTGPLFLVLNNFVVTIQVYTALTGVTVTKWSHSTKVQCDEDLDS